MHCMVLEPFHHVSKFLQILSPNCNEITMRNEILPNGFSNKYEDRL